MIFNKTNTLFSCHSQPAPMGNVSIGNLKIKWKGFRLKA